MQSTSDEHAEKTPLVPATPKPNFLRPPAIEELKLNLWKQSSSVICGNHYWVDPTDCRESDLTRMSNEERKDNQRCLLKDSPKYILMKPELIRKLSPEYRQEYGNSLKIKKAPKRSGLRNRQY